MEKTSSSQQRRTFLQRSLLAVGGAIGLGAAMRAWRGDPGPARPAEPAAPAPAARRSARTVTLHGRRRHPSPLGRLPGGPGRERVVRHGDLLEAPDGRAVGEFSTSAFYQEGPLGSHPFAANLELQTFHLPGGTLFGIGAPSPAGGGERAFAVLGGTGEFAGAQGSYVERDAGDRVSGAVEFSLSLV
jgi:hypothetical protein